MSKGDSIVILIAIIAMVITCIFICNYVTGVTRELSSECKILLEEQDEAYVWRCR